MLNKKLITQIIELGDSLVKPLFKEKQFEIFKKISFEKELTENEKRYLRGNLGKKLEILSKLNEQQFNPRIKDYMDFLKILNEYYITGIEALINNGYGWDLKAKIIEIINTKVEGELNFSNHTLKLIKIKSIKKSEHTLNKSNLIKYATNEQIIKDIKITKNKFVKKRWLNHFDNYGDEFSKYDPKEIKE